MSALLRVLIQRTAQARLGFRAEPAFWHCCSPKHCEKLRVSLFESQPATCLHALKLTCNAMHWDAGGRLAGWARLHVVLQCCWISSHWIYKQCTAS